MTATWPLRSAEDSGSFVSVSPSSAGIGDDIATGPTVAGSL